MGSSWSAPDAATLAQARKDYHAKFYDTARGTYTTGSQCALMMALRAGTVPTAALRASLGAQLVANIRAGTAVGAAPDTLNLGIVGTTHIFDVLRDVVGDDELAKVVNSSLYMVTTGLRADYNFSCCPTGLASNGWTGVVFRTNILGSGCSDDIRYARLCGPGVR